MLKAAVLPVMLCFSAVESSAAEVVRGKQVRGTVMVTQGDRLTAVTLGQAVKAGALIKTGARDA